MTEIDYLKLKLEDKEKAFDKLHNRHMVCLKKMGELEKENEQLKSRIAFFEEQEDEFEQYTAQTIEDMIAYYRDDW